MNNGDTPLETDAILARLYRQQELMVLILQHVGQLSSRVDAMFALQPELHAQVQESVPEIRRRMLEVVKRSFSTFLAELPDGVSLPPSEPPNLFSSN
jgi:hypothetical protein